MQVSLQHKQAFKDVLFDYRPSAKSIAILERMPLVILQGISGSGRNTVIEYMVEHSHFHQILSDTTRPPKLRNGVMEQHGVQYFFRREEDFLKELHAGTFLEAELIHDQQVSGISIRELQKAFKSGKTPINEVAREGVVNIRRAKADTLFFFVVPPSYQVWVDRLKAREVMSEVEFENRKRSAVLEIKDALLSPDFIFVANDSVQRCASIITAAVEGRINTQEDVSTRKVAKSILEHIEN